MRILVVSNLYPPQHIGGYELGCRDIVNALRARGHEVRVLTSTFCLDPALPEEPEVERSLHFVAGAGDRRHDKLRDCRLLLRAVRRHRADAVYFWNQAGLSLWLPMAARWLGYRVAFFLSDTHFVSWRIGAFLLRWTPPGSDGWLARTLSVIFGRTFLLRGWPVIQDQACHFASHFLRDCATRAGIAIAPETSIVIHWGIDPVLFAGVRDQPRLPLRLLYVGQLIPQKGVHTAIAALGQLAAEPGLAGLTLTIAGGGLHPDYEKELRALPAKLGIADHVRFLGKVPRTELAGIYRQHDILVFPSEWEEPFAITPLEAMAAGLTVVGTTTGGSGELFRDRQTAMTFAAGDATDCARAIRALCEDPVLWESVSCHGQQEVAAHYTLDRMVDSIEGGLGRIIAGRPVSH